MLVLQKIESFGLDGGGTLTGYCQPIYMRRENILLEYYVKTIKIISFQQFSSNYAKVNLYCYKMQVMQRIFKVSWNEMHETLHLL